MRAFCFPCNVAYADSCPLFVPFLSRSVPVSNIQSSWVTQMLACVGFLPQGRLLYLMQNRLDLRLIQCALGVLEGVELAVARGVVSSAG